MRVRLAVLLLPALTLTTAAAHAQSPDPSGDEGHTYTVTGLDAFPDQVFVAWPRSCGANGDPLGKVSLDLNPEWAARQHEVDYEVLRDQERLAVSPYCLKTMSFHVLPRADFPVVMRVATADDVRNGHAIGSSFAVLPALDAIELKYRPDFFASARQRTLPMHFDVAVPRDQSRMTGARWEMAIAPGPALQIKHVRYTYDDKVQLGVDNPDLEVIARTKTAMVASAATAADAGAPPAPSAAASSPPAAPASASPAHAEDRGTRWVYAAAVLGILAGGILAYVQKKKQR